MASDVDRRFPDNEHVEIVGGRPVIGRLTAKAIPGGADRLERLMKERLPPVGILDALAETEHWLGWTRAFGPISGFEAKLDRPRERYLSAAFCYGCGMGPTQAARSLKGLDRRHVAFVNQRHVSEETLDEAITSVIDAYAAVGFVNGALVAGLRLNPFIVTLATWEIFAGMTLVITQGYPIRTLGEAFQVFGKGELWGVPVPVVFFVAAGLLLMWMLRQTRFGRNIFALGGNRDAVILAGIRVRWVEFWAFGLAGMFAALAGILFASRMDAGQPSVGEGG